MRGSVGVRGGVRYYEGQDGIVSVWGSVSVRGGGCEGWWV